VIVVSAIVLAIGFAAGFYGVVFFSRAGKAGAPQKRIAADTIMNKRMAAIDHALKNGKAEYEFNFVSPSPVLGKQ
jgi:hypothetical protein